LLPYGFAKGEKQMEYKRNSAHWQSGLERLAYDFYSKYLNKKCISYRKSNFENVKDFCDCRTGKLKSEMYPKSVDTDGNLMNRHKIAAVHIQGFLRNPIFVKECADADETIIDLIANEYYCFLVLQAIINSWPCNKEEGKLLKIPPNNISYLLKLFYKYKAGYHLHTNDTTFDYALANIVYFIERCFLSVTEPLCT